MVNKRRIKYGKSQKGKRKTNKTQIEYGYISQKRFLEMCKHIPKRDEMYKLAFALMRMVGMRVGEVCKIKVEEIFSADSAKVNYHVGKTNILANRTIPTGLYLQLREYFLANRYRFLSGYFFTAYNSKYEHIQTNTLRKKFRKYAAKVGMSTQYIIDPRLGIKNEGRKLYHTRLYDLRASFGTDVQMKTKDIYTTSVMMRHTDTRSTMAYMRRAVLVQEDELSNEIFKPTLFEKLKMLCIKT